MLLRRERGRRQDPMRSKWLSNHSRVQCVTSVPELAFRSVELCERMRLSDLGRQSRVICTRSFATPGVVYGRRNMDPGTAGSGPNFEIAAKLTRTRSDSIDANSRPEGRSLLVRYVCCAAAIVSDDQMQPAGDASQVDGDVRCRRVTMDVGQCFLNDAKERPLHWERQLIDLRARPELDGKPRAIGIPVDVLADGRAQSIGM